MSELTVMVTLAGHDIEMRRPADGALVVLARVFRGIPKIENVDQLTDEMRDRLIRNLGTLGQVVDGMIVQETDKDWLDDAMISGAVSAEDVFGVIKTAGEKLNGAASPAKRTPTPVKRRR